MKRVLRKYKLGDLYKYVSLSIGDSVYIKPEQDICNYYKCDNKQLCNLYRAKTKVREYILCNDFAYFVTLTVNKQWLNRFDLDKFRRLVSQTIRDLRRKYNLKLEYLLIPERHKDGSWHMHGVLSADFYNFIYINSNGYDSLACFDKIGFNNVEEIKDKIKVSSYITKYITKDFATREKGKHLYFISFKLKKPVFISEIAYSNDWFDRNFFDFYCDYCFTKYDHVDISYKLIDKDYKFITN